MSLPQFQLLPAVQADAARIAALAYTIWQQHYPAIIGQQQVDYMLNLLYSEQALVKQMEEGQQFFLIEQEGRLVGYVSISEKEKNAYFLHKFYIDSTVQSRGLGKAVFQALTARFPSLEQWTLTVNRKNFKSINFYFRIGFVIERVADFDIGEGYLMEDFVMIWKRS